MFTFYIIVNLRLFITKDVLLCKLFKIGYLSLNVIQYIEKISQTSFINYFFRVPCVFLKINIRLRNYLLFIFLRSFYEVGTKLVVT